MKYVHQNTVPLRLHNRTGLHWANQNSIRTIVKHVHSPQHHRYYSSRGIHRIYAVVSASVARRHKVGTSQGSMAFQHAVKPMYVICVGGYMRCTCAGSDMHSMSISCAHVAVRVHIFHVAVIMLQAVCIVPVFLGCGASTQALHWFGISLRWTQIATSSISIAPMHSHTVTVTI